MCWVTFQLSDPQHPPMMLQGHSEEVTCVSWCPTDFTKVGLYCLCYYHSLCRVSFVKKLQMMVGFLCVSLL